MSKVDESSHGYGPALSTAQVDGWSRRGERQVADLNLSWNKLVDITVVCTYGAFSSTLKKLDLSFNKISMIPSSIRNLKALECFIASDNNIQHLPVAMVGCVRLEELILPYNQLSEFPTSVLHELPRLKVLNVVGNPLPKWPVSAKVCTTVSRLRELVPMGDDNVAEEAEAPHVPADSGTLHPYSRTNLRSDQSPNSESSLNRSGDRLSDTRRRSVGHPDISSLSLSQSPRPEPPARPLHLPEVPDAVSPLRTLSQQRESVDQLPSISRSVTANGNMNGSSIPDTVNMNLNSSSGVATDLHVHINNVANSGRSSNRTAANTTTRIPTNGTATLDAGESRNIAPSIYRDDSRGGVVINYGAMAGVLNAMGGGRERERERGGEREKGRRRGRGRGRGRARETVGTSTSISPLLSTSNPNNHTIHTSPNTIRHSYVSHSTSASDIQNRRDRQTSGGLGVYSRGSGRQTSSTSSLPNISPNVSRRGERGRERLSGRERDRERDRLRAREVERERERRRERETERAANQTVMDLDLSSIYEVLQRRRPGLVGVWSQIVDDEQDRLISEILGTEERVEETYDDYVRNVERERNRQMDEEAERERERARERGGDSRQTSTDVSAGEKVEPKEEEKIKDIPEHFLCPITYELLHEPVVAADGHTYEKTAIEHWFHQCQSHNRGLTSPLTGKSLSSTALTPNYTLRSMIAAWRDKKT